jgi:hypothetical protein
MRDTLIEGFSHFVASMTAPIASGWSGCRVGFTPTGKRRLVTAHTHNGRQLIPRPRPMCSTSRSPSGRKVLRFSRWYKAPPRKPDPDNGNQRVVAYLSLLAIQIIGALLFIWKELPTFIQLLRNPGAQVPFIPYDDLSTIGILLVMQVAYWCRLRRIPIPFQGPNQIQSHLFLFLGRISFIFGGALFSVVFFRHLPALDSDADALLMTGQGLLLGSALFALFCLTLELERLGHALEVNPPG